MKRRTRTRTKNRTKSRTRSITITALTAVILLSTSAWAIASKAAGLDKSKVYLSSKAKAGQVTSIPVVTKETILNATVNKETISNPSVTHKALIAKGKAYTKAIAKAEKEEVQRKAEALAKKVEDDRLAKIAESKAKKAEVIRLAKVATDKAEKAEVIAKQAEASKVAQAAASKAKQEEIDRIAAERADTSKQAIIAENYKKAKAAFDKAEQVKATNLAKIESDRLAKEETGRLAKEKEDARLAKEEAGSVTKEKDGSVTKEKDGSVTKEEADKLAKIEANRLARIEANRLAKIEAEKLAKKEADRLAAANGLNQTALGAKLASYLNSSANVSSVLNRAVQLHGGDPSNTCVYFSSEVMRRMGVSVPLSTCNTRQYLSYLKGNGWIANYDIKKLTPGSICFTSNDWAGYPTHTFVFLGWANSNYTLAYIADNQGSKVHVRDMRATYSTDKFAYFMHN